MDLPAVLQSVRKTGRLLVADTGAQTGGAGAELISQVVAQGFDALRAGPVRVTSPDHPAPSSPFMAENFYPTALTLAHAALALAGRPTDGLLLARLQEALARTDPHDTPHRNFSGPF